MGWGCRNGVGLWEWGGAVGMGEAAAVGLRL